MLSRSILSKRSVSEVTGLDLGHYPDVQSQLRLKPTVRNAEYGREDFLNELTSKHDTRDIP